MDRETFLLALFQLREKTMGDPARYDRAAGELLKQAEREADEEGDPGPEEGQSRGP